jgi:hypothetical protein
MREYAYGNKKIALAFGAIALVLSAGLFVLPMQQAHAVDPPTSSEITAAINLGNVWFNDNVKWQTPETDATTESLFAEYQSLPLKFRDDDGDYILVGENKQVGVGVYTTKVYDLVEGPQQDIVSWRVQVCVPTGSFGNYVCDAPRIKVTMDYDYPSGSGQARLTILHEEWINNGKTVDMDIGIGQTSSDFTLSTSTEGQTFTKDFTLNGDSIQTFRSHRYTERHAVQIATMWADILDNAALQTELETALTNDGYTLEKDIYAPLFDQGTQFGYEFMYESGANGVYRDCYISPASDSWAYEYNSKVCTVGVDTYISYSKTQDILVPMLWAIHLLNKGWGIDTDRGDGWRTWSPRDVAREAENWWLADYGIKSPYSNSHASSVRTSVFLILETLMADRGDTISDDYRDKAAEALMQPRNIDGNVVRENEDGSSSALYRPIHKGTWYTAWNGFDYVAKKSVLQQMSDAFNQVDEHPDIKPTNAESTILAMQALHTYRCQVYAGDCENVVE